MKYSFIYLSFMLFISFPLSGQNIDTISIKNPIMVNLDYQEGFISICSIQENLNCLKKRRLKRILREDSIYFKSHNFYNYLDPSQQRINTDWDMDTWIAKDYKGMTYYQYDGSLEFFRIKTSVSMYNNFENGFGYQPLPKKNSKVDSISVIAPLNR